VLEGRQILLDHLDELRVVLDAAAHQQTVFRRETLSHKIIDDRSIDVGLVSGLQRVLANGLI